MTTTRISLMLALSAIAFTMTGCEGNAGAAPVDSHDGHDHGAEPHVEQVVDPHEGHNQEAGDAHAEAPLPEVDQVADDPHAGHGHEAEAPATDVVDDPHAGHEDEGGGVVEIDAADRASIGLMTTKAEVGSLDQRLTLSGTVAVRSDRVAHITAPVTSQVRGAAVQLEDEVSAGEVLAHLRSTDVGQARLDFYDALQASQIAKINYSRAQEVREAGLLLLEFADGERSANDVQSQMEGKVAGTAQGDLIQAYANWLSTRVTLERAGAALERGVGSELDLIAARRDLESAEATSRSMADELRFTTERDLVQAEANLRAAETRVLIAERTLHMVGITEEEISGLRESAFSTGNGIPDDARIAEFNLSSPFDGRVIALHMSQGEWVHPEDNLLTVADLTSVWITARLFERDLQAFVSRHPEQAMVAVQAYPGERFPATLVRVGSVLNSETRTVEVVYEVENHDLRLRPEMFATAEIDLSVNGGSVVIQASAVQRADSETIMFVEEEPNEFHRRDVELGRQTEDWVEVLHGIEVGEEVVVQGAFRLRAELERGAFGDGHNH